MPNIRLFSILNLIVMLSATPSLSARPTLNFQHLNLQDGLPDRTVRATLQDRQGFVWLGTQGGLVRYDGQEKRVFVPVDGDSTSIAGRVVNCLTEAKDGRIWVGTVFSGLCRYDPDTEQFTRFDSSDTTGSFVPETWIWNLALGQGNDIWVTTAKNCLYRLDAVTGHATKIIPGEHWPTDSNPGLITDVMVDRRNQVWASCRSGRVLVMDRSGRQLEILDRSPAQSDGGILKSAERVFEGPRGHVWIVGYGGMLEWDPSRSKLTPHLPNPLVNAEGINNLSAFVADQNGILWVGGDIGLQRFDPLSGKFDTYRHNPVNPSSLSPGPVMNLTCDDNGIVWVAHWQGGVSMFDSKGSLFRVHQHNPKVTNSLNTKPVKSVYRAWDGTVWVGTGTLNFSSQLGGLNRLLPDGVSFERIPLPAPDLIVVDTICPAPGGALWLGTNRGVWNYEPDSGVFFRLGESNPEMAELHSSFVSDIIVDTDSSLWIGSRDFGLWHVGKGGRLLEHWDAASPEPGSLGSNNILCLSRDSHGRLWVGTGTHGLYLWQPQTRTFKQYYDREAGLYVVSQVLEAEDGCLWVAGLAALVLLDPEVGIIRNIAQDDGLPNDNVQTLFRDNKDRLWVSTMGGLTLLNAEGENIRTFDELDGLPTAEGSSVALFDEEGTAWLGTDAGLVEFRPADFTISTTTPRLLLTELRVNDRVISPQPNSILQTSITTTSALTLDHDENSIGLAFTCLDYARPDLLHFRYQLTGKDPRWRELKNSHRVSLDNLSPGHYTFSVQGTNQDGIWSPYQAKISIVVQHPWWNTPLSLVLYALLAILALTFTGRLFMRRTEKQHQMRLRLAEVEKLEELDRLKSRFFANISHEFRTPLTLIEGLLHRFRQNPQLITGEGGEMLFRNTRRLRGLIDQLLNLARLEAGRFQLKWHNDDLVGFVRVISSSFEYIAETRDLVYRIELPDTEARGWFDRELIETVVSNLLSNAMKYTPEGEQIRLQLTLAKERRVDESIVQKMGLSGIVHCRDFTLLVANTGSYLPSEDRNKIFNRFFQAAAEAEDGNVGSGIGLALVQELANLVGGATDVSSSEDGETAFTVTLPLVSTPVPGATNGQPGDANRIPQSARTRQRFLDETHTQIENTNCSAVASEPNFQMDIEDENTETESSKPLVLIVEDNADLRSFLRSELESGFRITTASDGQEGLEMARDITPDLIVSDVMMPRRDGMEMLQILKQDLATNHIPIILLTAKAEARSRKAGLRLGADDYLAKPLDPEELRIRIENLIGQHERLRRKYSNSIDALAVKDMPLSTSSDRFLVRALKVIDENMEDEDFSVDQFAREVGLSRTQLHRKLKALTGYSASRVIRRQRLKHAAELLRSGYGNVTEVAFAAGFKSVSHFSRNFRDQFGIAPSKYVKK